MPEDKVTMTPAEAGRWLLLALLVLAGVTLYFWLAPRTPPIVSPPTAESSS
jgi:hypothetical protein